MADKISVLISALLDPKSMLGIKKEIEQLQQLFDKSPIKIKLDIDNSQFKQFSTNLEKISGKLGAASKSFIDPVLDQYAKTEDHLKDTTEEVMKLTNAQKQQVTITQKINNETKELLTDQTKVVDNYKKQRDELEKLNRAKDAQPMQNWAKQLEIDAQIRKSESDRIKLQMQTNAQMDTETAKLQKQIELFKQKMELESKRILGSKHGNKVNIEELDALNKQINNLSAATPEVKHKMDQFSLGMKSVDTNAKNAANAIKNVNRDGYSLGNMMAVAAKKLIVWKIAGDAIFTVLRQLREIPKIVSEIDKSLTEVNKVLDLTTSQLKTMTLEATNLAIQYGKTTVEVLNSIGSFAKAGLDQKTSQEFAQLAMLLSNVGDISVETAQKTLIMANAGYQLGNDYTALNTLISQFNELANRNAIEVETLSESWQMSASIAKQAKLSITDFNAILTVAGSTSQRTGKEVGNALRTWLMRIQGVSDGADTLEDDVSKVDKVLSELGIQIKKSPTEFRPAMEVITEMAQKYKELGETGQTIKQSEMLEAMAGKYRANIVAGVLSNFDQINKALNDQANSFQSAEKENTRYMNSIQAKTKALQAQWELFASKTLDSDLIKGLVDFGAVIVKLADSDFARFILAAGILTASLYGIRVGIKAIGLVTFATNFTTVVSGMISSTMGFSVGVAALTVKIKALTATMLASPLFWTAAVSFAIVGIVKLVQELNQSYQKQIDKLNTLNQEYSELNGNLSETEGELKGVGDRIKELQSMDSLTIVEQEELIKLENINEQLRIQIENEKELLRLKNEEREKQAIDILNSKRRQSNFNYEEIVYAGTYSFGTGASEQKTKISKSIDDKEYIKEQIRLYDEVEKKIQSLIGTEKDYQAQLSRLNLEKNKYHKNIIETTSAINETAKSISGVTEEGKAELNIINQLNQAVNAYIKQFKSDFGVVPESTKPAFDAIMELNNALKTTQSTLSALSSGLSTYDEILNRLQSGQEIFIDDLIKWREKIPDIIRYIEVENGVITIQENAINALKEAKQNESIAALEAEKSKLNAVKTLILARLEYYKLEATVLQKSSEDISKQLEKAYLAKVRLLGVNPNNPDLLSQYATDKAMIMDYAETLQEIDKTISLIKTGSFSDKGSKQSKKEDLLIAQQKLTSELISSLNVQVEADRREAKSLENKIKTLEQQQKYNEAIKVTNQLLDNQNKTIDDIKNVQQKINDEANNIRSQYSQFDTTKWFADSYGTASQDYIGLIESFDQKPGEAAKKELETIKYVFSMLTALKKAYMDGIVSIEDYENSINSLTESMVQLGEKGIKKDFEDFQKTLEPLTKQFDDAQFAINRFNELLKHAPEERRAKYLDLMNGYLEEQKSSLEEQNKLYEQQLPLFKDHPELYDKLTEAINKNKIAILQIDNTQKDNNETQKKDIELKKQKLDQQKKDAEQLIDSYRAYIVEGINEEIEALENSKKAAKDSADAKIKLIQLQIDRLQEQNSLLKEQEDRQKRLDDLAKQRERISNIESVNILTETGWQWVTNPKKLREETEKLQEMEESYYKWERDLKEKKVIEDLQSQIKTIQDSLKTEEEGYDARIEQLREFVKLQDKEWKRQEDQVTSYQQLLSKLSEFEKGTYEDRLLELQKFVSEYNRLASSAGGSGSISPLSSISSGGNPTIIYDSMSGKNLTKSEIQQMIDDNNPQHYINAGWYSSISELKEKRPQWVEKYDYYKDLMARFDTGGLTGKWGNEGKLALLHEKELVLNKDDTFNMLKGVKMLRDIVPLLRSAQFKVPELKLPKSGLQGQSSKVINFYDTVVKTNDASDFIKQMEGLVRLV